MKGEVLTIEDGKITKCNRYAKDVVIPEGVRDFGPWAFRGCYSITTLEVPSTMFGLGVDSFKDSSHIEKITYHGTAAEWTFGLSGYRTFPESIPVHCVDGDAKPFDRHASTITIPEGVSKIDFELFQGCHELLSIEIPESVSLIRPWAFRSCTSLKSIVFSTGLKEIESDAFLHCNALTEISYKGTVSQWENVEGKNAIFDHVPAKCVHCSDGDWKLPSILIEKGVVSECMDKNLKSAKIPDGVTKIAYGAFEECNSLESVELPETLTELDWRAFEKCTALEAIVIPKSVTKIGHCAFSGCTSLKFAELGGCAVEIETSIFEGCSSLEKAVLREGITEIGDEMFRDCTSLKSVAFPNSLVKIKNRSFFCCTSLESVSFGDNLREITGDSAFYSCSALKSIVLGANVAKISASAFGNCTAVENVVSASPLYPFNEKTRKLYDATGKSKKAILALSKEIAKQAKIEKVQNASADAVLQSILDAHKADVTVIHKEKNAYLRIKSGENTGIEILLPDSKVSKWMNTLPALLALAANGTKTLELIKYAEENGLENSCRKYMSLSKEGVALMKQNCTPVYLVFPEGTTKITSRLWNSGEVKSIVFPSSLKEIGDYAVSHCRAAEEIIFTGTRAQWYEVKKDCFWKNSIPALLVKCSDGSVAL